MRKSYPFFVFQKEFICKTYLCINLKAFCALAEHMKSYCG